MKGCCREIYVDWEYMRLNVCGDVCDQALNMRSDERGKNIGFFSKHS